MKINLCLPMGGAGTRFLNNGYETPKPLIELKGRPFFYWAAQSLLPFVQLESLTAVVLKDHIERFEIDKKIRYYYPSANIVVLDHVLNGAVLTCMEGAKAIDGNLPVIFCDCDIYFRCRGLYEYYWGEETDAQGTLITFESTEPRYSFVRRGAAGFVTETAEKKAISSEAICGAYGFDRAETFLRAADRYLNECTYSEYYMSGIYNLLIEDGGRVRAFKCDKTVSFGTPGEYAAAVKDPDLVEE